MHYHEIEQCSVVCTSSKGRGRQSPTEVCPLVCGDRTNIIFLSVALSHTHRQASAPQMLAKRSPPAVLFAAMAATMARLYRSTLHSALKNSFARHIRRRLQRTNGQDRILEQQQRTKKTPLLPSS